MPRQDSSCPPYEAWFGSGFGLAPIQGRIIDPEPISLPSPQGLAHVWCLRVASIGQGFSVIEYGRLPAITSQVKARLPSWKFVPAMLGNKQSEVSARA